ncbi:hypothetical protein GCM10009613_30660 [Pseudonocardia kongjuensis]|uniref:Uncharacterized protein n=1 Tax=Pseudonocardia kongjuensis TaxID=102227 RepID=A0ABN1XU54_9PSEU
MLLLTHGGYRPDWRGTVSDVIYFTETQARAWEELSTQEEIWRSADLRIGHRCESCGNEWLTNPRHTKAVSKQRRGRTLFGLGAAALGGGFGGALSGLVGGQIHACPRCQGTKSRDRLLAFCARCTTLCTDQILRTCTKCNTPFGADIKSGTQWETKPSSWV